MSCLIRDVNRDNCRASIGPSEFISGRNNKVDNGLRRKFLVRSGRKLRAAIAIAGRDTRCPSGSELIFLRLPVTGETTGALVDAGTRDIFRQKWRECVVPGGNSTRIQLRKVLFSHYHFADGCAHTRVHKCTDTRLDLYTWQAYAFCAPVRSYVMDLAGFASYTR